MPVSVSHLLEYIADFPIFMQSSTLFLCLAKDLGGVGGKLSRIKEQGTAELVVACVQRERTGLLQCTRRAHD